MAGGLDGDLLAKQSVHGMIGISLEGAEAMWDWLNLSALNLVYYALIAVGVLYALIILITGGLSSIDLPNIDIGTSDLDIGGVHIPDASIHVGIDGGPDVDHGEVGVRGLSAISVATFITCFGAFGVIATHWLELSARWSLLVAIAGGLAAAALMQLAYGYFLIKPQGSSEVRVGDIIGAIGEVITPIPAGRVGEVAFVAQGARVTSSARSADGSAIPRGTIVKITQMIGSVVLVTPVPPAAREQEKAE